MKHNIAGAQRKDVIKFWRYGGKAEHEKLFARHD